ncbi:major facilitator superfamily domain-containing protein [Rhodocollybia butyracea]|uniref:Major facilitator superfamily domain-containing protein n=1 Tax=Rhodocollybia butyracea TaxID=206335 RepID=A0A9P5U4L5_9AGAR|nr:major facilitator superfamily domain-containing protein [Rhodocollybia butyracea]
MASTGVKSSANVPYSPPNEIQALRREKTQQPALELTDQTNLLPFRRIVIVFLALSLCSLVTSLDSLIISGSLSTVSAVFSAGSTAAWVPAAYLISSTSSQPLLGRLSDIFGRRATLLLTMTIYIIGNLAAGFSNSITQLIICRGIADAGGGGITSMLQIIISDVVPLRERGKYVGIAAGVIALGYVLGPILGGVLAETNWRVITLPVAFIATIMAIIFTPHKPTTGGMLQKIKMVDYIGMVLTLGGSVLIMLPLIWGGVTFPWNSPIVLAPLCCGIFVVVLFFWEWKGARLPIVPMHIFKHMTVTGVYISLYYLPQFFQVALGYSPTRSGRLLLPFGFSVSHTGKYRTVVYSGFALSAIGSGCISIFTADTSKAVMVVLMLITGIGNGMTMQTTTVAAQASVARKDMSVVTAVRNVSRCLNCILSSLCWKPYHTLTNFHYRNNAMRKSMVELRLPSSTITSIIDNPAFLISSSATTSLHISSSQATYVLSQGYTKGFRDIFLLNAAMSTLATVVSVFMIKHKELLRGDEDHLRKAAADAFRAKPEGARDEEELGGGKKIPGDNPTVANEQGETRSD